MRYPHVPFQFSRRACTGACCLVKIFCGNRGKIVRPQNHCYIDEQTKCAAYCLTLVFQVCFGIPSMGNLCERLTSKESVQVNRWAHVGLISEHNKLRLYLNGSLDCQRTSTGALRANRHPLYVGKVPDGAMRLDGVRGGVEGSIANLRYFTRALSPIHVRIICDPGPPEAAKVEDRHLYHLCACLVPISTSPACQRHFEHPDWLCLFLRAFTHGTVRVQQAVCRLLREILPRVPPSVMANVVLDTTVLQGVATAALPPAQGPTIGGGKNDTSVQVAFVVYLLRLVGATSWSTGVSMLPAGGNAAVSQEGGIEEASDMTVAQVLLRQQLMRFLPHTVAPVLAQGCQTGVEGVVENGVGENSIHKHAVDANVSAHRAAHPLSAEMVRDINTLGAEVVALVQVLAATKQWTKAVASALRQCLARLVTFVDATGGIEPQPRASDHRIDTEYMAADERLTIAGGEAALRVLGGTVDFLCAGAHAKIRETDQPCVVLGLDQAASTAYVILYPEEGEKKAVETWFQRVSARELEVQCSDSLSYGALITVSDSATDSLGKDGVSPGCAYTTRLAKAFLRSSPLPRRNTLSVGDHAHHAGTAHREIVLAQCRSRMARALLRASRDIKWARCAARTSDTLRELLQVAITPCLVTTTQIHETSLAEADTIAIQERLHQMLGTPGGTALVEAKIAEMMLGPGEPALGRKYGLEVGNLDASERGCGGVNHRRSVTPSADRPWMEGLLCPFWHQEKTTASGIVEHVLTKHPTDARRVPCPVCVAEKGDNTAHDLPTHLELVHFDAVLADRRSFLASFTERGREAGGARGLEARPPSHLVEQLMVIGFPEEWCIMALRENDNDVVNASAWIVDNLDMLSSLNNLNVSSAGDIGEVEVGTTPGGVRSIDDRHPWQGSYRFARRGLVRREGRQQFGDGRPADKGGEEDGQADEEEEEEEEAREEEFGEAGSRGEEEKYHEDEEDRENSEEDDEGENNCCLKRELLLLCSAKHSFFLTCLAHTSACLRVLLGPTRWGRLLLCLLCQLVARFCFQPCTFYYCQQSDLFAHLFFSLAH